MPDEETALSFSAFVISLATTAAVHFGDVVEPGTAPPPPDLGAAGQMIEILGLLEEKTRGNLTPEESKLLEQVLYELRMRFVQARGMAVPPQGERKIIIP
jgi:hypothetical protein